MAIQFLLLLLSNVAAKPYMLTWAPTPPCCPWISSPVPRQAGKKVPTMFIIYIFRRHVKYNSKKNFHHWDRTLYF